MKLSEFKTALNHVKQLHFDLPDGKAVPAHFHLTEIGLLTRDFIDCGGTKRLEKTVNMQFWEANDFDHRLSPEKLLGIIDLSADILKDGDYEVEVEYQSSTIGKYHLAFDGERFKLLNTKTACLASDQCGVPAAKPKVKLAELQTAPAGACCTPGGGCS
ncbi:MAG: hypothetical protein JNK73_01165 [Bacteroidia bacterium]|nr:hypothetical protein [Bacteroidia bacterium]